MRKSTYYMGISLLKILRKDDKWCNQKRDAYCCVTLMNKHEHYLWMLHCFICFIKCRYCTFQISSYYCYKKYTTKCNKQVKSSINIFFSKEKDLQVLATTPPHRKVQWAMWHFYTMCKLNLTEHTSNKSSAVIKNTTIDKKSGKMFRKTFLMLVQPAFVYTVN